MTISDRESNPEHFWTMPKKIGVKKYMLQSVGLQLELTVVSPFPGEYPSFPRAAGTGRGRGKTSGELRGITGTGNSFDLEGVRGIFPEDYQNSNWGRGFFSIPRSSPQYTKYVSMAKSQKL